MEKNTSNNPNTEMLKRLETLAKNLWKPLKEIYRGCKSGVVPWQKCIVATLVIQVVFLFRLDYFVFQKVPLLGRFLIWNVCKGH